MSQAADGQKSIANNQDDDSEQKITKQSRSDSASTINPQQFYSSHSIKQKRASSIVIPSFPKKKARVHSSNQNNGQILATEPGEKNPNGLSPAGARALQIVPGYVRSIATLMPTSLNRMHTARGLDKLVAERLTKIQNTVLIALSFCFNAFINALKRVRIYVLTRFT